MITVEDKIEGFKKIINEEIKEKVDNDLQIITSETDKKVAQYKEKRTKDLERIKKEYATRLEHKTQSIHSKTLKDGQNIILFNNRQIYEEFFKDLKAKLKANYNTSVGEMYLKNKLSYIKEEVKQSDKIYVSSDNYDRDKNIISQIFPNNEVQIRNEIKIGGFEVENSEKTYKLNYSLDFLVEQKNIYIQKELKRELEEKTV